MYDAVDVALTEDSVQCSLVADIRIEEKRTLSRDLTDTVQGLLVAVDKIINHNNIISGVDELNACMRTDETGPSSDKNHNHLSNLLWWQQTKSLNRSES
jgi:hypothetical protein